MTHRVLLSVNWDVDWIPTSRWDVGRMSIGSPGVVRESSWLRLVDGNNSAKL